MRRSFVALIALLGCTAPTEPIRVARPDPYAQRAALDRRDDAGADEEPPTPEPRAVEGVESRRGVGYVTAAVLGRLFAVEVEVAVVDSASRAVVATRSGCAVSTGHLLVTARRLVAPHEYEPELAALVAGHAAQGRSARVRARFIAMEEPQATFVWPAAGASGAERGLETGPEQAEAVAQDGLRPGRRDTAAFVTRGEPVRWDDRDTGSDFFYRSKSVDVDGEADADTDAGEESACAFTPPSELVLGLARDGSLARVVGARTVGGRLLGAPVAEVSRFGNDDRGARVVGVVTDDRAGLVVGDLPATPAPGSSVVATRALRVHVVDVAGRPMCWIQVHAYAGAGALPDRWLGRSRALDGEGVFEVLAASAGPTTLVVREDAEGPALLTTVVAPGAQEVRLALGVRAPLDRPIGSPPCWGPCTSLRVLVFDDLGARGRRAPRARVVASRERRYLLEGRGQYELREPTPGRWTVDVEAGGREVREAVDVVDGQVTTLEVVWAEDGPRVGRSRAVEGRWTPETLGQVTPGAPISWLPVEGGSGQPLHLGRTGGFGLPWIPRRVDEAPLSDQGTTLALRALPSRPGEIELEATLRAGPAGLTCGNRPWWRRVPFLVALEADGAPVFQGERGTNFIGKMQHRQEVTADLLPPGGSRSWRLRLSMEALDWCAPRPLPRRLALTLAFCEVEEPLGGAYAMRDRPLPPITDLGVVVRPPVLVRSERVFLERGPYGWVPARDR